MSKFTLILRFFMFTFPFFGKVNSHGRLLEPPGRSSLWRFREFKQYKPEINYNDHELFCRGLGVFIRNGKKCGVCGDDYSLPRPRDNENGGKFGQGVITRTYKSGQVIQTSVEMMKSHWGHFEYHLCSQNEKHFPEVESCFKPIQFADGSGTEFPVLTDNVNIFYNNTIQLPPGLKCEQCVLRWYYKTATTWGPCPNGTEAKGCGDQETFWGCSDIAII